MKKGFTLVELLAVIVILAVILVIAVPQINNVIKQTKTNSLASTAKLIASKAEEKAVENEILESDEALTCANLVKLDDNYGNCTVTVTNGVATVTLVGSGKFAGLRCTGTKSNMTCTESNGPEYVYSYGRPYYHYEYTITDINTCKTVIKQVFLDMGYNETYSTNYSNNICNNTGQYGSGTSQEWFDENIEIGIITIDAIETFATLGGTGVLRNAPVNDYSLVRTSNGNTPSIFIRWPSNTVNFDKNDFKELCGLYNNNLVCAEILSSSYSSNMDILSDALGETKCTLHENSVPENYNCSVEAGTEALQYQVSEDGTAIFGSGAFLCYVYGVNGGGNGRIYCYDTSY